MMKYRHFLKVKTLMGVLSVLIFLGSCKPKAPVEIPSIPWITSTLSQMTLEEKAGQVLMVYFPSIPGKASTKVEMNPLITEIIDTIRPGGVLFFGDNFLTAEQTKTLNNKLQSASKIILFLATDEEGGRVSRLGRKPAMGVPHLPSARKQAEGGVVNVENLGAELGQSMKALGLNMNLGPIADLDTAEGNPLGDRAFSKDPQMAGVLAAAFVRGLQSAGILSVIKHFPGLGMVTQDPHFGQPVWDWNQKRFEQQEGVPFFLADFAAGMMVAHLEIRGLESKPELAPWSPKLLTGILRDTWHYQGLIMTDALNMGAVSGNFSPGEETLKALLAGADLILMPPDPQASISQIVRAVKEGLLPIDTLDRAVGRILGLKATLEGPVAPGI